MRNSGVPESRLMVAGIVTLVSISLLLQGRQTEALRMPFTKTQGEETQANCRCDSCAELFGDKCDDCKVSLTTRDDISVISVGLD